MSLSDGYRSLIKRTAFVYASLLINQVSRAVYLVVVARVLGPELYGLLAYGQAWYLAFLPLSLFGLGPLLARALGRDREAGRQVANNVASIRIATILVTAVASGVVGISLADTSVLATLMMIFGVALAGRAASLWADQMFQAYETNHLSFEQAKVFRTTEVLLGIAVALLTKDVVWVASVHALVWLAQGAHGLFLVVRHLQPLSPRWHWLEIRLLLIAGLPLGLTNVFDALMVQGGVILFKRSGAADELVGNLAIDLQAMLILGSLFAALSTAVLPAVSRSVARGDTKHRIYLSVVTRLAFVFATLAAVWALAIGADIVELVLGAKYQITGQWLWLMLWVLIPSIIKQAINNVLVAHGNYWMMMWLGLAGVVSTAGAVLLLLGPYGFSGVIAGMLIGFGINAAIALLLVVRMRLLDHPGDIAKLALIVTLTVSSYFAVAQYRPLLAAVVATAVLAFGTILLGVIRDPEKKTLLGLIRRRA